MDRLKQFRRFSASHRKRVLDREGITTDQFRGYGRGDKSRVLQDAFSAHPAQNLDISAPLTPEALDREINSQVRLKYHPVEQQYNQQLTDSRQTDTNIDAWYGDYLKTLGAAQAGSAKFYQDMAGGDVAVPGAVPGDEASQAAANRATLQNEMNSALKAQGAGANDVYGQQGANAQLAKIGYHQDQTKQRKTIGQSIADLDLEKGDYANQLRSTARDSERQYGLEASAFNLDTQKENDQVTTDLASIDAKKHTLITSGPFAGFTHVQVTHMSDSEKSKLRAKPHGAQNRITSGAFAGYTQSELNDLNPDERSALVHDYRNHKSPNGKKPYTQTQYDGFDNQWSTGLQALRDHNAGSVADLTDPATAGGYGVDANIAQALVYWKQHGAHLTPQMKKLLKRHHVKFKDDGYKGIG